MVIDFVEIFKLLLLSYVSLLATHYALSRKVEWPLVRLFHCPYPVPHHIVQRSQFQLNSIRLEWVII